MLPVRRWRCCQRVAEPALFTPFQRRMREKVTNVFEQIVDWERRYVRGGKFPTDQVAPDADLFFDSFKIVAIADGYGRQPRSNKPGHL
jgi:hypothetical protein